MSKEVGACPKWLCVCPKDVGGMNKVGRVYVQNGKVYVQRM